MKVLTIGSAMIDTIAIIGSARIERMTMLNAESSFLLLEEGRKKRKPRRCLRTPEAPTIDRMIRLDVAYWPFATFRWTAEFGRCWRYSGHRDALARRLGPLVTLLRHRLLLDLPGT